MARRFAPRPFVSLILIVIPFLGLGISKVDWRSDVPPAVASYSRVGDTVVVMVIDPLDLVSCNQAIAEWMAWDRGADVRRLVILLTRRPEAREGHWIRSTRVPVASELAPKRLARLGFPRLFLLDGTNSHRDVVGAQAMRSMLNNLDDAGGPPVTGTEPEIRGAGVRGET